MRLQSALLGFASTQRDPPTYSVQMSWRKPLGRAVHSKGNLRRGATTFQEIFPPLHY